jgi:hypothetical protein
MTSLLSAPAKSILDDDGNQFEAWLTDYLKFVVSEWECEQHSVTAQESSMWKVSSALQKTIRRNQPDLAVKYAQALFNGGKASYLWSRLPIIVLEDIGVANPLLCAQVLAVARWVKIRQHLGEKKILCWLVDQMARSLKSRALCDLTCAVEFKKRHKDKQWLDQTADDLILHLQEAVMYASDDLNMAVDHPSAWVTQLQNKFVACARLLGDRQCESLNNNEDPPEFTSAAGRKVLMEYAATRLDSIGMYVLLASAKRGVDFLNAAWLPIMQLIAAEGDEGSEIDTAFGEFQMIGGVPEYAFDQHVSNGKRALAYWAKADEVLAKIMVEGGLKLDAVCMLHFQIEAALLDSRFATPYLEKLTAHNDWFEAEYVGIKHPMTAQQIRDWMTSSKSSMVLRAARVKVCS